MKKVVAMAVTALLLSAGAVPAQAAVQEPSHSSLATISDGGMQITKIGCGYEWWGRYGGRAKFKCVAYD